MKKTQLVSKVRTSKNGTKNTAQAKMLADKLIYIAKRYEHMASMYSCQYRERDLFPASFYSQSDSCVSTLKLILKICPAFLYATQKSAILNLSKLPANAEELVQNMQRFIYIMSACLEKILQVLIGSKVSNITMEKVTFPVNDSDAEKTEIPVAPVSQQTEADVVNLFMAAMLFDTSPASEMLKSGADPNEVNEVGQTPLHFAASHSSNPEMIDALVSAGANINAKTNDNGSPLPFAIAGNPSLHVLSALIKNGADVNSQNDYGETPLMIAALHRLETEATEMLLRAGADPNTADFLGRTALMFAAINPNPEVTRALLKAGADARARRKDGKTAAMIDSDWNMDPEIKTLLAKAKNKAA